MPIKGKNKTTKTSSCQLIHKIYTYWWQNLDWCWSTKIFALQFSSVEETDSSSSWKSTSRQWWSDFWRITDHLQDHFLYCHHWSDEQWKNRMAGGGWGRKKRFQYCSDSSGTILYLRDLQGHSRRNPIDPSLQDNVLIPNDFFEYICHVGCAINLHSIISSGLIPARQSLSNRQTVLFLPVNPMTKNTRILIRSTWKHRVLHDPCTKHGGNIKKSGVLGRHQPCSEEDWSFIGHDRTPSFFTKHSQLNVSRKLFGWKLEKSYTRGYMRHLGLLQRFPWNMTGGKIWVQKLLDNQNEKLRDKQKNPYQANQIQTQIMIERRSLLFALKKERPILRNRSTFFSWRSCDTR